MGQERSLNPCFNGRYSQSNIKHKKQRYGKVLILVLMEDTLRGEEKKEGLNNLSLNPCFNGRYSQRLELLKKGKEVTVLILVLMEDTLRVNNLTLNREILEVLILVLMEDTLRE